MENLNFKNELQKEEMEELKKEYSLKNKDIELILKGLYYGYVTFNEVESTSTITGTNNKELLYLLENRNIKVMTK